MSRSSLMRVRRGSSTITAAIKAAPRAIARANSMSLLRIGAAGCCGRFGSPTIWKRGVAGPAGDGRILVGVLLLVLLDLRLQIGLAFEQCPHRAGGAVIGRHGVADNLLLLHDGFLLIGDLLLQGVLAVAQLFEGRSNGVAL